MCSLALRGAFAPDISLYGMVSVSIWGMDILAQTVIGARYSSDAQQSVFAVDNNYISGAWCLDVRSGGARTCSCAFTGATLLHLALDVPLHTHNARQNF